MKIKSIKLEKNKVLGNIELDFTDENHQVVDTIIIAGENGLGKSTLLDIIYEFSNVTLAQKSDERREFKVVFSDEEMNILKKNLGPDLFKNILNNEFVFYFYFSNDGWNQIQVGYETFNNERKMLEGHIFTSEYSRQVMKALYSDVEINFRAQNIGGITSKNIDTKIINSQKSSPNLATEISQLLIDIQTLDNDDFVQYCKMNSEKPIDINKFDIRMKRFNEAFEFMFENKKCKGILTTANSKQVIFEENDKEIPLNSMSSGEKQIIYRGSFLLKDKNSCKGAIVLIDEPEISLHPKWQLKILDYYKRLFADNDGLQTSQMFVVTHSPFIIHNVNRNDDKVIILKKDNDRIHISSQSKFYSWSEEEIVKKAFNLNYYIESIKDSEKPLIITEGSTDWKHILAAYLKLREDTSNKEVFDDLDFELLQYEPQNSNVDDSIKMEMGCSQLCTMCESIAKLNHKRKIIFIADRDDKATNKKLSYSDSNFKYWGNNVYSLLLPIPMHRKSTPEICIEHYYKDEEIKTTVNINGIERRLYMGNEFNRLGINCESNIICENRNLCGANKINIIEGSQKERVTNLSEEEGPNLALSKMDFATKILNNEKPFDNFDFSSFMELFMIIKEIISLEK